MRKAYSALCLPAVAALWVAGWQPAPAAPALPHDERLDNGLRVILVPHRANPMIASSVVVGSGVIHEPEGMNGVSHFLEHLLFNGTETRTQRELYDEADRYGAINNATTREDHTLFFLLIQKEFARQGLELQADMLFRSTLPEEKFDKEKGIVLEELARSRNDPTTIARTDFRSFAFSKTPLARPVLGSEESIGALRRDDVVSYYRSRYVPSNMVLTIVGDFEVPKMAAMAREIFGTAPPGSPPQAASRRWPPRPDRPLRTGPLDAGRTIVHAAFPFPAPTSSTRLAAAEILLSALGSGDDAPLARSLKAGPDPAVLSYSLGLVPRAEPWSTVELEATPAPEKEPLTVVSQLVVALRSLEPGSPAWDRIPSVLRRVRAGALLDADRIHYAMLRSSSYVLGSPEGFLPSRVDVLDRLDEAAFRDAAAAIREGIGGMRIGVAGPGIPSATKAWAPPAPADAHEPARAGRFVVETLPSGLRIVAGRDDDSRVFAAHLLMSPRAGSEPAGKDGITDFLHRLFVRGTLVRDAAGLARRLDEIGARLKVHDDPRVPYDDRWTGPEYSALRLEMPSDRWREGIDLLAEIVRFPRLAPDDIEAVRAVMLDLQERRAESARDRAIDLLAVALAPGHPLSRPVLGTPETISSIGADDLRAYHGLAFTGRRLILSVIGPADPGDVIDAIRAGFSGLPAGEPPPEAAPLPLTPPGREREETLGKEQSYIALGSALSVPEEDLPAMTVACALLSDALSFRLREERGLAYAVSASCGPRGGRSLLRISMGTRPANVPEAVAGLKEVFVSFRETAHDADAVARAASALRGRLLMRRLSRVNQAAYLGLETMRGRSPGSDLEDLARLLTVSPEDVARVIRTHFDPDRLALAVVR